MFDELGSWVSMAHFRPYFSNRETALSLVFHHIRPTQDQRYALPNGHWIRLPAREVSLIAGLGDENFICFKRLGNSVGPGELYKLYSAAEIMKYRAGYFTEWHLPWSNFYGGPWEVFNGPKRIVIRNSRS
jgi:hypothetical protein